MVTIDMTLGMPPVACLGASGALTDYMVVPIADFEKRLLYPYGRQVAADNIREAIRKARADVLDAWMRDHSLEVDGWYVVRWVGDGWVDPEFVIDHGGG